MALEKLQVSGNKRYLVTESNKPFFYLGETAWELFHRCTREEADLLLTDRAAKGFNVVQAVALAEIDGLNTANSYGNKPFEKNDDPGTPVEAYWEHVDWIVNRANELGMYIGFLPTWGDKWAAGTWGGPVIFNETNAYAYGKWVGSRYRDSGLIWILGGDRPVKSEQELAVVRAMARGLREGDGGAHLCTFHPPGAQSSSKFVHCEDWLDFHMQQTGHSRERASWMFYEHDWDLLPNRPFVNGEPPYEAHPNNFRGGDEGWLDQNDVRRELYWAICGGAAGFTYGCHAIWQMYKSPRAPINGPRAPWDESLALPGSSQMHYGMRLVLSRPFAGRQPGVWQMVKWPHSSGTNTIRACRGEDGSWAFIYCPDCQKVKVDLNFINADRVAVTWFNPRTGKSIDGGECDGRREESFQPPFDPNGRDWIVILDDPSKKYPAP